MPTRLTRTIVALTLATVTGCAPPPPPPPAPPPPAPPPPPPFVFHHEDVWTARPGVVLATDSARLVLPRPLTRLRVVQADSPSLLVRCAACADSATGRVALSDVVYEVVFPQEAERGSLAEFALAVRAAAAQRDVGALRPVMAPGFSFAFVGQQGPDEARAAWNAEGYRSLARVPELLDRGLATRDSALWVAPPEHLESLGYRGLRLGFRQDPSGAWRWVFLIRGEDMDLDQEP